MAFEGLIGARYNSVSYDLAAVVNCSYDACSQLITREVETHKVDGALLILIAFFSYSCEKYGYHCTFTIYKFTLSN